MAVVTGLLTQKFAEAFGGRAGLKQRSFSMARGEIFWVSHEV